MNDIQTYTPIHLLSRYIYSILAVLAVVTAGAQSSIHTPLSSINPSDIRLTTLRTSTIVLDPGTHSLVPVAQGHTALFCVMEEIINQESRINLRLRLGSLQYVNQLEGKPHHSIMPDIEKVETHPKN